MKLRISIADEKDALNPFFASFAYYVESNIDSHACLMHHILTALHYRVLEDILFSDCPMGCAHMLSVSTQDMTFPTRCSGVRLYTNDIICMVNIVADATIKAQHGAIIQVDNIGSLLR